MSLPEPEEVSPLAAAGIRRERFRSPLWVAGSNWLARGFTAAGQVVLLPLITRRLGVDHYSVYLIVVSLAAWYAIADLGVGAAIQNRISEARARGESPSRSIGAAGLALAFLLLVIAGLVLLLHEKAAAILFSGIPVDPAQGPKVLLLSGVFLLGNTAGVFSQRILYAYGHGVAANGLLLAGNLSSFALMLLALTTIHDPDSLLLACAAAYSVPLGIMGAGTAGYLVHRWGALPFNGLGRELSSLATRAAPFCFLAIAGAAIYNIDILILSQVVAPSEMAGYGVFQRVLGMMMALYSAVLAASWPVWAESLSRGQIAGVQRSAIRYSLLGSLSIFAISSGGVLFHDEILRLFLPGTPTTLPRWAPLMMGIYLATRVWTDTFAVLLQAASDTKIFWIVVPAQGLLSTSLQVLLGREYGAIGVLLSLIIALWVTAAWALPRRALTLHRRIPKDQT